MKCIVEPGEFDVMVGPSSTETTPVTPFNQDNSMRVIISWGAWICQDLSRALLPETPRARALSRFADRPRRLDWIPCFPHGRSTRRETSFCAIAAALQWFAREKCESLARRGARHAR